LNATTTIQSTPPENPDERGRALYDLGKTTIFAHRVDPRFSYCMYAPPGIGTGKGRTELVVMMHGTGRSFVEYRDAMAEFGRWHNCIILCPLFPVGVRGDGNRDGFKHLREGDIRYDQVLIDIVAEVAHKYGTSFDRFALSGYSGGGQFVNRFLLLHPHRLWAASIGAPGSVTLVDDSRDWWVGTANVASIFGREIDRDALARVPVQLVVGALDQETWEITHREGGRHWMPGANDAGATRPERAASLQRSLQQAGVSARLDVVPGVAHNGMQCLDTIKTFISASLDAHRQVAK
jgi:hypothetical protein